MVKIGATNFKTMAYRCIHTCKCLGKAEDERRDPEEILVPHWRYFKSHIVARGRHPNCPRSCPGHHAIENPDHLTPENLKASAVRSYLYKCTHTCQCAGSEKGVSDISYLVFETKRSARRHLAGLIAHPSCTQKCPAFRGFQNAGDQVEPLLVPAEDIDNDVIVLKEADYLQPAPNLKRSADQRDENSITTVPNTKKSRVDPSSSHSPRSSQSTPLGPIEAPESQRHAFLASAPHASSKIPAMSSSRPISRDSHISSYDSSLIRPVNYELTGTELIVQYLSALNELCKRLSQVSPELQALSMGLYILPHITSHNAHFAISGSPTVQSVPDIPAAFISMINKIIEMVEGASKALGELLQVKDQDGLLDAQDPKTKELRRRVAKLYDQIIDLRLDIQRAVMKDEVEGLVQEKGRVKEAILEVSTEVNDIGEKMKELMVEALNQLSML